MQKEQISCADPVFVKSLFLLIALCVLSACTSGPIPVYDRAKRAVPVSGIHVVRTGETLYSIAWSYGKDFKSLARANGVRKPYLIKPGQELQLRAKTAASVARSKSPKATTPITRRATQKPSKKGWADSGRWKWPAKGQIVTKYNISNGRKGIDISGVHGQAVFSARSGKVVYSGNGIRGYGNLLIVKHNEEYLSAYAYNSRLLVAEGQQVKEGQKIAEIGSSGKAREAKLHFEIRRGGQPVDPLRLLPSNPHNVKS